MLEKALELKIIKLLSMPSSATYKSKVTHRYAEPKGCEKPQKSDDSNNNLKQGQIK
jgi:hypothetical protein